MGGSSRSGRELTSTATPNSAHAAKTTSASNSDSGRCRDPVDHPAGAVAEHVGVRVAHRGDHPLGHRPARHPQLRVHARHDEVELGEQLVLLVERAVVEDVHLDAGEDAERRQLAR